MTDTNAEAELKQYALEDALWTDQFLRDLYKPRSFNGDPTLAVDAVVELKLAVSQFGPVTVAPLTSSAPHYNVYRGWAKRSKGDKNNPSAGASLAVARALKHYANALESQANRLVNGSEA